MNSTIASRNLSSMSSFNEPDLGYGQLFGLLWRQRWYVIAAVLLGGVLGGFVGLQEKSLFTSSMQFLVEPNYRGRPRSVATELIPADAQVEVDMATQMKLMQSSELIKRAMVQLQQEYPALNPNSDKSVTKFKSALTIAQVSTSKDKDNRGATKIFQINYSDPDPEKSKRVLKAMEGVYKEYNLEQQQERLTKGLSFVNSQIPQAEQKVNKAESRLQTFQTQQGVVDPELQAKNIADALTRLNQDQQTVRTQLRDLQSRNVDLQNRIGMSPQQAIAASRLTQSPRYQSLLNELQKTDLAMGQQLLKYKPGTPEIDQFNQMRQQQMGLLQVEVGRIVGGTGNATTLLSAGQLGQADLALIQQMVTTQVDLQGVVARYQNLVAEEQKLRQELQRFPQLLATYNRLKPDIELNRDTLRLLMKAQQDIGLEIARGGYDWQVVEAPQLVSQTQSGLMRNLLLGGVVGLFLGGGLAFAREASDDSVHDSAELKKQASLPLLGMLPEAAIAPASSFPTLAFNRTAKDPIEAEQVLRWQPFREAMDLLYQNIQLLDPEGALKSIVITSALAGEGKSTVALGLAISAARLHRRVLLVDGDLRRSRLHELLNLQNDRGLSSLLMDRIPLSELLPQQQGSNHSNIAILPAGPAPRDPAKLLSSPRMREMMQQLEASYDLVIVDAPPVMGMVDSLLEASCCSGALLVGRLGHVTKSELTQTIAALNKVNVIGVVANGDQALIANNRHY
jgi:polysaccharide biosynthesis transport protein